MNMDGWLHACRSLPIPVLTGLDVEEFVNRDECILILLLICCYCCGFLQYFMLSFATDIKMYFWKLWCWST